MNRSVLFVRLKAGLWLYIFAFVHIQIGDEFVAVLCSKTNISGEICDAKKHHGLPKLSLIKLMWLLPTL